MGHELKDDTLVMDFTRDFGSSPDVIVKAPGRVNLIGEHTDYNGFPVLPISIPFAIKVAASLRTDKIVSIKNTRFDYHEKTFELSGDIPHSDTGDWSNYVKAAITTLASISGLNLSGMNALFHGDIPSSAGLSSSSALVVASALALLAVNHKEKDSLEIAEMMAYGEHYVGTQGGGMDQAICLLGKKGYAVRIDFFPLTYSYVFFPENYSIIVAHSLVQAAKTKNAMLLYNRRPAECRLATAIINAHYQPEPPLKHLGDLTDYKLMGYGSLSEFVEHTFKRESYSLSDITKITHESTVSLINKYLLTRSGIPMPPPPEGFLIRQRAFHVLSEADRVDESRRALEQNDAVTFGKLMNESHQSCDENYNISTPELNVLVSIMRENGALGARLTGAGFGGCAIGLFRDDSVALAMEYIKKQYYEEYISRNRPDLLENNDFDDSLLFAVKPSDGAIVKMLT